MEPDQQPSTEEKRIPSPHEEMYARIKEMRLSIDAEIKQARRERFHLNQFAFGGHEMTLCIDRLTEAKLWLGKVLEAIKYQKYAEKKQEPK